MNTSTKIRLRWDRIAPLAAAILVALCIVGLSTWIAVLADEQSVVGSSTNGAPSTNLEPCATEDSDNCYWLADVQGNGAGRPFVTIDGHVYYLDGAR